MKWKVLQRKSSSAKVLVYLVYQEPLMRWRPEAHTSLIRTKPGNGAMWRFEKEKVLARTTQYFINAKVIVTCFTREMHNSHQQPIKSSEKPGRCQINYNYKSRNLITCANDPSYWCFGTLKAAEVYVFEDI